MITTRNPRRSEERKSRKEKIIGRGNLPFNTAHKGAYIGRKRSIESGKS